MKIELLNNPITTPITIHTTRKITNTIQAYADNTSEEVSWLGLTEKVSDYVFNLLEIFLVPQECNSGTTEMIPEGLVALDKQLRDTGRVTQENQDTTGLYFWGHSHHTMGVGASGQDNNQFRRLASGAPYYIRQITNKRGENNLSIILPDKNIIVGDLCFSYENEEIDIEGIRKEMSEKIKTFNKVYPGYINNTQGYFKRKTTPNFPEIFDFAEDGVPLTEAELDLANEEYLDRKNAPSKNIERYLNTYNSAR